MAARAVLAPPQTEAPEEWPFHQCKWGSIPAHLLWKGDRRFEADNFLSTGFGIKAAIEGRAAGWNRLGAMIRTTQPNRIKATIVSREYGTPFLVASQMFSIRPHVRKWLAAEKLDADPSLYAPSGTIIVRRSADVGRSIVTQKIHERHVISDHFFRVDPIDPGFKGWIYAFLKSRAGRLMMTGAKYGHIINHIERSHLEELPVPVLTRPLAAKFNDRLNRIISLRDESQDLTLEAEQIFEGAVGSLTIRDRGEEGFSVKASSFMRGRRRLEATPHNPGVKQILAHLQQSGTGMVTLKMAHFDVWLPGRFKRTPAQDGVWFLDSSDLFETNPDITKRIAESKFGDDANGRVKPGWLLLARSGQTYGLNGSLVLATEALNGKVISDHVMRIAPQPSAMMRTGYVLTALSHPLFGRPVVKSLAYGSSIPEIDPTDFENLPIVRLKPETENRIADLAEQSAALRAEADVLEREMAEEAGRLIDSFLAGDVVNFVVTMPAAVTSTADLPASSFAEHAVVRLRHALKADGLKTGDTGTIVHVYADGAGYEVEFLQRLKRPKLVTVEPADIELAD